jgi:hypothetical protein
VRNLAARMSPAYVCAYRQSQAPIVFHAAFTFSAEMSPIISGVDRRFFLSGRAVLGGRVTVFIPTCSSGADRLPHFVDLLGRNERDHRVRRDAEVVGWEAREEPDWKEPAVFQSNRAIE